MTTDGPGAPAGGRTGASVLRRALGLRTVVSTSTGLAFAALEYLAAAGLVVYVAGDSAWIAVGTAGLLALMAWGCFSELNGMFPTAAAIRLYMRRSMDDRVALTITFTYLSTIVLVVAADAFVVGTAIAHVLGQSSVVAALVIVALLGTAVVSNLRGVKVAGGVQDVATYGVLVVTVVVALTALLRSHHGLRFPFSPLHGHHPGDFLEAVALGVFLFSAFEWVTTSAEEVRRPRDIHRGMLIALALLVVVCSLITVAMSHLLDHRQLVSAYPQLFLGRAAFGPAGLWLMAVVTAATAVNTFNGGFITASRFIYATAREGSLPAVLAKLNDRAVPWVPVVALGTASLVVSLVVAVTGSWEVLVAVGAALEASIYAVAAFCVVRLRARLPDQTRPFRLPAPRLLGGAAIAVFGVLAVTASVSVSNRFDLIPLVVIAVGAGLSALYVLAVLPRVKAAAEARQAARTPRRPPDPPPRARSLKCPLVRPEVALTTIECQKPPWSRTAQRARPRPAPSPPGAQPPDDHGQTSVGGDDELDPRKAAILNAVVSEYIETAEPVGSAHITGTPGVEVSSATVRSDMAALERDGYLTQPHTSAGRIPTDKGYRFFVDTLGTPGTLGPVQRQEVRSFFAHVHGAVEDLLGHTSGLLANLTDYAAVVVGPTHDSATIRSVQLVDLGPNLALLVVVLSDGAVEKRAIELTGELSAERSGDIDDSVLAAAAAHLTAYLRGRTLADPGTVPDRGDGVFDAAVRLGIQALGELAAADEPEHVFVGGSSRMASAFDAVETVRSVLSILEQQLVVVELVEHILDRGLSVAIGSEHGFEPLASCALVLAPVSVDGETAGTIGVVGPTRMNYPRALAAVQVVGERLGERLGSSPSGTGDSGRETRPGRPPGGERGR